MIEYNFPKDCASLLFAPPMCYNFIIMNGALLLLVSLVVFAGGYWLYSAFLGRRLGLDPARPTPAQAKQDGMDYVPAHPTVLFGHHFAAIAGAGPIVGPVLAAEFGWASVVLWVLLGCVFAGLGVSKFAGKHAGERA